MSHALHKKRLHPQTLTVRHLLKNQDNQHFLLQATFNCHVSILICRSNFLLWRYMLKNSRNERSLLALFRSGVMSTPAISNYFLHRFVFFQAIFGSHWVEVHRGCSAACVSKKLSNIYQENLCPLLFNIL